MSGCRRAKSAKSGMSRCVARVGASVTRRSPRTLWSRPKTRVSSRCDDASIWYRAAFRCDLRPEYARHAVHGSEGVATFQRRRIDLHDRVSCFGERFSWLQRVCGEQGDVTLIRTHVAQRTEGQEYPGERAEPGADRHTDVLMHARTLAAVAWL